MKRTTMLVSALVFGALTTSALAKVPQAQVNRLGNDLTPMGAEKAGDGGDIPAWTGGLQTVPSNVNYKPGDKLADPFKDDPVKYTITSSNAGQYDDVLTPGYKALLSTYKDYKMNVYQTRRSCAYPDKVYEANKRNAAVGELVGGRSGDYTMQIVQDEAILAWSDPAVKSAEDLDNISLYYIANTIAPARSAGNVILVYEALNAEKQPRQAWQYSPGTRRVRRAPNIAYDNPGTNSDGLSTSDSFDGYNGAPDRYDWTVLGKHKRVVAANDYEAESTSYDEFIKPLHLNQDKVRYELRRVWEFEANLKAGTRHVYSRRVYHNDEDAWQISTAELYDGRGQLWRVQELHQLQRYNVPLCGSGAEIVYDLQAGRYLALAMQNEEPPVNYFADEIDKNRYTPNAIRQMGVR